MPGCKIALQKSDAKFGSPVTQTRSLSQDYLDALLMRVMQGSDNWYRNHFPVILETNMSHYFNERIYNEMNVNEETLPTMEFGVAISQGGGVGAQPYEMADKVRNL